MSGWTPEQEIEQAALTHLTDVLGAVSARQIVDGLLAKGRAQVRAEVRREAFAEAADMVDHAFHNEPFLNYPPDFATYLRERATQDADDDVQPPAGAPAQPAPDFFQSGQTYTDGNGYRAPELVTYFRVEHITRHPDRGHLRAIGWTRTGAPGAGWHGDIRDEGEFERWTEVRADPADRFPSFDASGGEGR